MLQLSSGDLLCILHGRGMQVCVQHGYLVATQEQDPEDTGVSAEAPFRVARQGKTILAARCDASVLLDGRAADVTVKRYYGPTAVVLYQVPGRRRRPGALACFRVFFVS